MNKNQSFLRFNLKKQTGKLAYDKRKNSSASGRGKGGGEKTPQRETEKDDDAGEIKALPLRVHRRETGEMGGESARVHGAVHLVLLPARPHHQAPQAFRGVVHPERGFPAAVQQLEADPAHAGQGQQPELQRGFQGLQSEAQAAEEPADEVS